jgi:hypothetical protein
MCSYFSSTFFYFWEVPKPFSEACCFRQHFLTARLQRAASSIKACRPMYIFVHVLFRNQEWYYTGNAMVLARNLVHSRISQIHSPWKLTPARGCRTGPPAYVVCSQAGRYENPMPELTFSLLVRATWATEQLKNNILCCGLIGLHLILTTYTERIKTKRERERGGEVAIKIVLASFPGPVC